MRRINRGRVHRDELRADAERRQEERATRSPREQLVLLDQRLGEGLGAVDNMKGKAEKLNFLRQGHPH